MSPLPRHFRGEKNIRRAPLYRGSGPFALGAIADGDDPPGIDPARRQQQRRKRDTVSLKMIIRSPADASDLRPAAISATERAQFAIAPGGAVLDQCNAVGEQEHAASMISWMRIGSPAAIPARSMLRQFRHG